MTSLVEQSYLQYLPGVNFINILSVPFCRKVFYEAFLYLHFGFVFFLAKAFWHKSGTERGPYIKEL